jgi:hypothetical protein
MHEMRALSATSSRREASVALLADVPVPEVLVGACVLAAPAVVLAFAELALVEGEPPDVLPQAPNPRQQSEMSSGVSAASPRGLVLRIGAMVGAMALVGGMCFLSVVVIARRHRLLGRRRVFLCGVILRAAITGVESGLMMGILQIGLGDLDPVLSVRFG